MRPSLLQIFEPIPTKLSHSISFISIYHSSTAIFVTQDDSVYTIEKRDEKLFVKKHESLCGKGVHFVAALDWIFVVVTRVGEVFLWGENFAGQLGMNVKKLDSPRKLKAFHDQRVISISFGKEHVMALTSDGSVYCWGSNSWKQIGMECYQSVGIFGRKKISTIQMTPVKVKNVPFTIQICAGDEHSLALTRDGVYGWGSNRFYQLADNSCTLYKQPKRIQSLESIQIIQISAGAQHSAALDNHKTVYVWGGGLTAVPTAIKSSVSDFVCYSNGIFVESSGSVYVWYAEMLNRRWNAGSRKREDMDIDDVLIQTFGCTCRPVFMQKKTKVELLPQQLMKRRLWDVIFVFSE